MDNMNNNYTAPYPPTPPVNFGPRKQNIALCIILSFLTCAIYKYYWVYRMTEDVKLLNNNPNGTSGGMVVLLSLLTCDIYLIYWMYTQGEAIDAAKNARQMTSSYSGLLYLLLSLFGFGIISMALMQHEINSMAQ